MRAVEATSSRAPRPGRHGRSVEGAPLVPRATGGGEADPAREAAGPARAARHGGQAFHPRSPGDRQPVLARTRSSSTISGRAPTGPSTTRWNCWKASTVQHFVYRFGPIEPQRAVHWLRQACHSLGEAHAQGPDPPRHQARQLYLCRYGRDVDFVKVLDFGLTKVVADLDSSLDTDSALATTSDALPGISASPTPGGAWNARLHGAGTGVRAPVRSARGRLPALGCVGYWLLAGVKPFEAETAAELLRHHAQRRRRRSRAAARIGCPSASRR